MLVELVIQVVMGVHGTSDRGDNGVNGTSDTSNNGIHVTSDTSRNGGSWNQ